MYNSKALKLQLKKILKTIREIRYLEVYSTKEVQHVYTENYKTSLEKILKDPNK